MSVDVDAAQKGFSVRGHPHYVISVGTLKFSSHLNTQSNFKTSDYFSCTNSVVGARGGAVG